MLYLQYIKLSQDVILIFRIKWEKFNIELLAITGGIQGTSGERPYDELGLHSLAKRR